MNVDVVTGLRWSPSNAATRSTVLEYSAASHIGCVRTANEDAYLAGPPIFVVADGMGGYSLGDVASAIVVGEFEPLIGRGAVTSSDIGEAIARSRRAIEALSSGLHSPGSTVVVASFVTRAERGYWLIAHEGDSRAYVYRLGGLEQVTRDHSLVQELIDAGQLHADDAREHPERHVVTRAVGGQIETEPEFCLVPVEPGSRLLLCSDGLTSELSSDSIALLLAAAPTSAEAVAALLAAAVEAGGHDNVTVLVVDVAAALDGESLIEDTLSSSDALVVDTLARSQALAVARPGQRG